MISKICRICDKDKPITEYFKVQKTSKYFRGECKTCNRAGKKVYNAKPPVRLSKRDASRKARRLNHIRLLDYIGGSYICNRCSYSNTCTAPFDFHHIDPTTKHIGVGKMMQLSWTRVKLEVDKCELLCSNCHRIHHYNETD